VACLGGSAVCVFGQGRSYRVGWLGHTATNSPDDERALAAFRVRLRELGFTEGGNLVIEGRYAEGHTERFAQYADAMARLGVDLVVTGSGIAARAVMATGGRIPVVVFAVPDPVPSATRIAIARCSRCTETSGQPPDKIEARRREEAAAARSLGVTLVSYEISVADEFDAVAAALRRCACRCLHPTGCWGALLSYGPDYTAIFRSLADYVARILNGAKPADLPMQEPTIFEFVINQRIAKAIGVAIPQRALLRADVVIE
jgi:putative ABC transport system substrate-binding protein